MSESRYRVRDTDYRYGRICPRCPNLKSLQAARCRSCYADDRRTGRKSWRPSPAVCACGKPMWATSSRCRACWLASPGSQPQTHRWRGRPIEAARV